MISLQIPYEDIEQLRYERFHHPHPRVQIKAEALLLKSQMLPHWQIAKIVGICENTLRTYLTEYQQGGIERLKQLNFYTPVSLLTKHRLSLEAHFRAHPPATIKHAVKDIETLTGIKRSLTQVRTFFKHIGLVRRKVGQIPAKADRERQEIFKQEQLEPLLKEAKDGKIALFFVDAAHFVFAPFLGFLWCFARVFVKAAAGRSRHNILGALNAVTHDIVTITNNSYITAQTFCAFMHEIVGRYATIPITLILDNARYQKCELVRQTAATLGISLVYLPPYSPNLNLIERLWKFVKKQCLYSKCYQDFAAFSSAIDTFLETAPQTHATELASLLTHNFQCFPDEEFVLLQAA